jgi:Ca-activated chloride channel family protein
VSFHYPSIWFLIALALIPFLWLRWNSPRRRSAATFSSLGVAKSIRPTWVARCRWIVPALRMLAIGLLIVAIARPRKGDEHTRINTEGIAIQLIVDRSGSMRAMDFTDERGKQTDRLTAVKKVVEDFVVGSGSLPGRRDDVIGAIAFATFADSICPITSDHAHLVDAIRKTSVATERGEGETAIGDAIALGVERLRSLESRTNLETGHTIKSKIMILLTDGENNAGDIDPLAAAQMAAAYGIKIYTIGAGTDRGVAPLPGQDFFGNQVMVPVSIDERSLRKIADIAGGQYFRATDTDSLRQIYEHIDKLERTQIHERRFVTYKEAAVEFVTLGPVSAPPLLMSVLVLLATVAILENTRFRTLP